MLPILLQEFKGKNYVHDFKQLHSACLIGNGSEVLGYDTTMSEDHDFGPRLLIFLGPEIFGTIFKK